MEVNYHLLQAIPTNFHFYKSIDTVVDKDELIINSAELGASGGIMVSKLD